MYSVYERPVCEENTVYEGLQAGFKKVRYEKVNWQWGYEPKSYEQNLGYEKNLLLRVKTAKSPPSPPGGGRNRPHCPWEGAVPALEAWLDRRAGG